MKVGNKKFLSCFLLALSLNRNACSSSIGECVASFLISNISAGALVLLSNWLISNPTIPTDDLSDDNGVRWDVNDPRCGDGWYTRGEIMSRYEEFIKEAMEDDKDLTESGTKVNNFPYEGLGTIDKEEISNVAYFSSVGCKVSFDNSNNVKLNLYPGASKLFENDLFNLPENVSFNNSSDAFKLLIGNLNAECRRIFNENSVPVKAENCRYNWKVSDRCGVVLERDGQTYATDENFEEVKLTVYNDETNDDNKKIIPKKIVAIFIVELKRK